MKWMSEKKLSLSIGVTAATLLLVIGLVLYMKSEPKVLWEEYTSSTLGFSVSHPADWKISETDAESGPDILVQDSNGYAFVRIRGFVDPYLNSAEALNSSIEEYERNLALQDGVEISSFQSNEMENDVGGFSAIGDFSINDITYRFEERGWLSMAGQVLILRAADVPQNFEASLPTMEKIMDSFEIQ